MDPIERTETEQRLDELCRRLSGWRNAGVNKGRYIPKEIWQEAGALAKALGVAPVSRRLGLFFPKLKSLSEGKSHSPRQKHARKIVSESQQPGGKLSFLEVPLQPAPGGFELRMRWGVKHLKLEWG